MERYIGYDKIEDKRQRAILKRVLRKAFNAGLPREMPPLTEAPRVRYTDDYSFTEYGYIDGRGLTDDDLREIFYSWYIRVNSPYDCTGKAFTVCIDWHRNPCGLVSYHHKMSIDL